MNEIHGKERWTSLWILSLVHGSGKLCQYLFGIVAQDIALSFRHGKMKCSPNYKITYDKGLLNCSSANDSISCTELEELYDGNNSICIWEFSEKEPSYQILVGPPFTTILMISGIIFAMISDRFNRRNVVAFCFLMITVAAPRTGVAEAYWELVVHRMILIIGESAFIPACSSMIADMFTEKNRGLALGIFCSADVLSLGMAYFIGHFVTKADVASMGWRFPYFVTGFICLIAIMLLICKVYEPDRKCRLEAFVNFRVSNNSVNGDYHITNMSIFQKSYKSERSCSLVNVLDGQYGLKRAGYVFFETLTLVLVLATSVGIIGSSTWKITEEKYFSSIDYPFHSSTKNAIFSMVGGTLGLMTGGAISDLLAAAYTTKGRLYVIVVSQFIASIFAFGVLCTPLPWSFYCLLGTYFFGEMWYGIVLTILLDVIPPRIQATIIAIFIFVAINIGQNAPVLISPMENALSYKVALHIMYPGSFLISSLLFFVATLLTEPIARRAL